MELIHFITYFSEGLVKQKERTYQLKSNDIETLKIPDDVIGFRVFDKASDDIYLNGEKVISKKDKLNVKIYYIGTIKSIEDIKNEYGESSSAYTSLLNKKYYGAIKTRSDYLLPLELNKKINVIAPDKVGIICTQPPEYEKE